MKRKRNIVLSILSLIFLIILPLFVGVLSSWNYTTSTPSTLSSRLTWYVENDGGEDYILDQKNDLDVQKNEIFKIYTTLEDHDERANTLYIYNQFQLINVYVDNELIYTNDTSSNRFFGKAEERRIHLITLPSDMDGKRLTIEYSCPYKYYAGKIHGLIIASREELFDKIVRNYIFPLTISMIFFCSTLALFLTSFFFLKEYKIFTKMNNLLCACLFLSVSFLCESKLLTLFFDIGHTNLTHLFLVLFNLFVLKFLLKEKEGKKERVIPFILMILNVIHLIVSCFLQLFNIFDVIEISPITLILQNSILAYYFISKLIEFFKHPKLIKEDRIFLIETIFITLLLGSNIFVFNYDFTNPDLYLISGGIFIIYIYIRYSLSIRFVVHEARKSVKYESELKETKNYLINSQMKSHFVFNTLGAIRTMIVSHPKMAYEMTTDFTKYLRANISNTNSTDLIPFQQELEHIKAYLSIETKRFMNRLNVVYDIKTVDFSIPPLSVEPLVENAVKHGVCKKIKGGTVKISTNEDEKYIYVIVEDDGIGFNIDTLKEASEKGSVGLRYIKTRLKQLANADFDIMSSENVGTKAIIKVKK